MISVILPVYNKEKYIKEILTDLIQQTFSDFECIIIDDGSTDGSEVVCDQFAAADSRFRVVHIPNGGVSHARNTALDIALGEYIAFVDADDRIHRDYLNNLYQSIQDSNADMVICSSMKIWENSDRQEKISLPFEGLKTKDEIICNFAKVQQGNGIYGYCWGKLLTRQLVGDTRFDERIRLAEDLDFYIRLYPKVSAIYFSDKPYYYYLQEAENSSMLDTGENIDYITQLKIQKRLADYLEYEQVLHDDNLRIMVRRLYDYVYFSLFHGDANTILDKCQIIEKLELPKCNDYSGMDMRQRWVVKQYCHTNYSRLIWGIKWYRGFRLLKRRCLRR